MIFGVITCCIMCAKVTLHTLLFMAIFALDLVKTSEEVVLLLCREFPECIFQH